MRQQLQVLLEKFNDVCAYARVLIGWVFGRPNGKLLNDSPRNIRDIPIDLWGRIKAWSDRMHIAYANDEDLGGGFA